MLVLTKRFSIAILEITISSDRGDFWLFLHEDWEATAVTQEKARLGYLKIELTQYIIL